MDTNIQLSTKFLTTQNAHQVGMLITVAGEKPVDRRPINVALVLDRSGSMTGEPLEAAKDAAIRFATFLGKQDRLSVVVFDDSVETVFGPQPAGDTAAEDAIRRVEVGGSTNLSGGWLKGREHVQAQLVEGTNRVVLLTDGCANQGITDSSKLNQLARGASRDRVSTTCIGFGEHFNEDLLREMGEAGGGNYWYVENIDQMGGMFDEEIEGLVALAAQNLEISVHLTDPRVAGVSFPQSFEVERTGEGAYVVTFGDLYATSPRVLGIIFHVENLTDFGQAKLGDVVVKGDHLVEDGVEHRITKMPVIANLDTHDHVEPEVEARLVRFEAAKAREEAVRQADEGDFEGAARSLRGAHAKLGSLPRTAELEEEMEDLDAEARRMEEGEYGAADRKYHLARSAGAHSVTPSYIDKLSRSKRKKRGQ
ncbi:MAG: VWA domain-containing protein [Gemmatimonadota bacterium]|nr:MAG: VWA domain-containing protein [Gemmatimonadota bacterium]